MTAARSGVDGRTLRAKAQREERKAQILDAAMGVFAENGYHRSSISDLVTAAGVARGTFYLYFDSKQAIFLELLDRLLSRFRDSVQGVDTAVDAAPLDLQLELIVGGILRAATQSQTVAQIIFREAVGLDEPVEARLRAFEAELHGYLVAALDNGVRLGMLRDLDTDVVATCFYGSLRQVMYRYVVHQTEPPDVAAVARTLIALHLDGVRR